MVPLPLADILHHRLRSLLSAVGVAIAVCMLITLSGLSRGSLMEIADRWDGVGADLIVYPARWGDNITTLSGGGLSPADVRAVRDLAVGGGTAAEAVVPVFMYELTVADQRHAVAGVDPDRLHRLLGGGDIRGGGRVFDPEGRFAAWLRRRLTTGDAETVVHITPEELARAGGLEMVIDDRLARAAGVGVGGTIHAAGHDWTVVGIAPDGAMVRVFVPRATAEYLFNGPLDRFTLLFVKLRDGVPVDAAAKAVRGIKRLSAAAVSQYRAMLVERFGVMYVYVDVVNAVTLVVAFLFILVTLYTMVIQRTREIAILKSMGAGAGFILLSVLGESLLLTGGGAALGIAASPAAAAAIEAVRPLLTVRIQWTWVLIALGAAGVGGALAALYPAYCAMRVDTLEALSLE